MKIGHSHSKKNLTPRKYPSIDNKNVIAQNQASQISVSQLPEPSMDEFLNLIKRSIGHLERTNLRLEQVVIQLTADVKDLLSLSKKGIPLIKTAPINSPKLTTSTNDLAKDLLRMSNINDSEMTLKQKRRICDIYGVASQEEMIHFRKIIMQNEIKDTKARNIKLEAEICRLRKLIKRENMPLKKDASY